MPQFKVVRKAFGPRMPGGRHELLAIGDVITAEALPGDAYEPLDDGGAAQAASPAAVASAKKRAARAAKDDNE